MGFRPDIYKKNIFEIDYDLLKNGGIKCLVFDLDNTLGLMEQKKCPDEVKELIYELKRDFLVVICTNNFNRRIKPYLKDLDIDGVCFSLKPTTIGLNKIKNKYHLSKSEMCLIGDQLLTDVLAGNRFHITTVLVDPMGEKELKITGVNRFIENIIMRKYQKRGIFERGKYYE
ncbi:MAG: HAD-IIIA family hydrolase [Bacilli bacterium]|nr:HAD-IIIA family hydrolase [Bacilli bacterium]MBR6137208.1 HAD-IIIA family hydrolase [Bacilli bacterium]